MNLNHIRQHNIDIRNFIEKSFDVARTLAEQPLHIKNCPVCESNERSFFAVSNGLKYWRCNDCTLLYMSPSISPEMMIEGFQGHDELMMEYFRIMSKYKCDIPGKPDPRKDSKLVDIYEEKKSGKLLDVGCAFGDFLHKARHFYDVEGVEVNPYTAAIAEQYFTIHKKFLAELDLPAVYDIVVLHEILYGTSDPIALLKDIAGVMKDDAILYIHSGNSDSYATQLYRDKVNHLCVYTMLNVFNRRSLERLAERSGFRIKSFRTEWLDIYLTDLLPFLNGEKKFIHKKNVHIDHYEEKIQAEDVFHSKLPMELGDRGNYLIAILEKKESPQGDQP